MCILFLALGCHPLYPLVVAFNRDEDPSRPTLPLHWWEDQPDVLAGRDLRAKGTWLGVNKRGMFAALTNCEGAALAVRRDAPSRGCLVADFLTGTASAEAYIADVAARAGDFASFNLVLGDPSGLFFLCSEIGTVERISPGRCHAWSNTPPSRPFPKVSRGLCRFQQLLSAPPDQLVPEALFDFLRDKSGPPPDGHPVADAIFVQDALFATRTSTVLMWRDAQTVDVWERTFPPTSKATSPITKHHTNRIETT